MSATIQPGDRITLLGDTATVTALRLPTVHHPDREPLAIINRDGTDWFAGLAYGWLAELVDSVERDGEVIAKRRWWSRRAIADVFTLEGSS